MTLRSLSASALFLSLLLSAGPAQGQIANLFRVVGDGGSWIKLEVEKGRMTRKTSVLPLAGMKVNGCFRIWDRHSGAWTVRAEDALGDAKLDVTAKPGEPVRFEYQAGLTARFDFEIEWSEPRDTTLFIWVGLAPANSKKKERDICQPPS